MSDKVFEPCPFCESENVCLEADHNYYGSDWWVTCDDCGCRGPKRDTAEQATDAWNTAKCRVKAEAEGTDR
jgi:hypothetical protein